MSSASAVLVIILDRRSVLREAGVNPELEATAWRRWVAFRSERFVLSSAEGHFRCKTLQPLLGELLTCDDVPPKRGILSRTMVQMDGTKSRKRATVANYSAFAIFSFSAISLFRANFFIRIVSSHQLLSTPPIAIFRSVR
ncbi:hypothetical protein GWK47_043625 [Chionoecetes opilio]|uniref:Uncharacterized protein n=1 Tax=Chionoecetes opilio TaxID=41210 RepID=A0A8J4YHD1_CHIOP|nr:hypothetical protein GWK47_043625 [Chionoecetes opilio]